MSPLEVDQTIAQMQTVATRLCSGMERRWVEAGDLEDQPDNWGRISLGAVIKRVNMRLSCVQLGT